MMTPDELEEVFASIGKAVWHLQFLEDVLVTYVTMRLRIKRPIDLQAAMETLGKERKKTLRFRPYRLISAMLKSLRSVQPEFELWRDFHYEYEPRSRQAIDVINGGPSLRSWVDDPRASAADWDAALRADEESWMEERRAFLLYA